MSEIKDSGTRRKFESGAVRDIAEGKGRMDLVPLGVVANLYAYIEEQHIEQRNVRTFSPNMMLNMISNYMETGYSHFIYYMLWSFIETFYEGKIESAILDVSVHYEQGAQKYEERNWEKGIPCHCYIDSAARHGLKFLRGDSDERHDRAFMWNLLGLLWTVRNKPEFNDLYFNKSETQEEIDKKRFRCTKKEREKTCDSIIDELEKYCKKRSPRSRKWIQKVKIY